MDQAILTSASGAKKRTNLLLALNIFGVLGCLILTIVLILWALNIILKEPNTHPGVVNFIKSYKAILRTFIGPMEYRPVVFGIHHKFPELALKLE